MDFTTKIEEPYNRTAVEMLLKQLAEQKECSRGPKIVPCDERPLYTALMGYGFLVVFCLALFGNCLNLLIYNSDQIRYYIAIRMLCTKLLMNTLTMLFLLPQALRIIHLWEYGNHADMIYWRFWPYQTYLINVFGFCAMWLTVLMTAECYVHVFFPSRSKTVCTMRNVSKSCILIGVVGMILALIYPLNRKVHLTTRCHKVQINIAATGSILMNFFEVLHTVGNLFLAIIIPLTLLVFMTASIVWRLLLRRTSCDSGDSRRFSAEKRCVTRLTLITTSLQLISECPAVPVFIYAALHGPHVVHTEPHLCLWHTNAQYLGICNASLSFFVYIVFSQRFRAMLLSKVHRSLHTLMPCVLRAPPNIAKNTNFNYSQANDVTVITRLKRTPPTMDQRKKSVSKCSTGDGAVDLVNLVSSRRGSHAGSRIHKFDTLASTTNDFDALL